MSCLEKIWNDLQLYNYQKKWMNIIMPNERLDNERRPMILPDGSEIPYRFGRPVRGYTPDSIILDDSIEREEPQDREVTDRPQPANREETSLRDNGSWSTRPGILISQSETPERAEEIQRIRFGEYIIWINYDQDKVEIRKNIGDKYGRYYTILEGTFTDCIGGFLNFLGRVCNMKQPIEDDKNEKQDDDLK